MMTDEIRTKYEKMLSILRGMKSAILAFSGGVDSSFMLMALTESGIERYVAVIATSPTMPKRDLDNALAVAKSLNANYMITESKEMEDENFAKNPTDRCFYCKSELFGLMQRLAKEHGYDYVLDGSNMDDLGDYRPGLKAKEMHEVRSPMVEAGLSKEDIRVISKDRGLKTWDRPSSPCLSSRIPYGEPIELKSLRMIEDAEIFLRERGFEELRVRKQGDTARIEVPAPYIQRLISDPLRSEITSKLKEVGFLYVTVDMEGLVSGKLNRVIPISTIPIQTAS